MLLPELQYAFAQQLQGNSSSQLSAQVNAQGISANDRLAIYENNMVSSLTDALASTYPATYALIGEACFNAIAKQFVLDQPPSQPALIYYGADFSDALAAAASVSHLLYLPDVARLEWAMNVATHADDDTALSRETFADIPAQQYENLVLHLCKSVHMMTSPWPVDHICAHALARDDTQLDIRNDPAALLIWRPAYEVQMLRLNAADIAFLNAVQAGKKLHKAYDAAVKADPAFDLSAHLSRYFRLGIFAA